MSLHQLADLDQRRLTEILTLQQIRFSNSCQVTKRPRSLQHTGRAVTATNRQFKVGDGPTEQLFETSLILGHIIVVIHFARRFDVFHVHQSARMILIVLKNPAETEGRR